MTRGIYSHACGFKIFIFINDYVTGSTKFFYFFYFLLVTTSRKGFNCRNWIISTKKKTYTQTHTCHWFQNKNDNNNNNVFFSFCFLSGKRFLLRAYATCIIFNSKIHSPSNFNWTFYLPICVIFIRSNGF